MLLGQTIASVATGLVAPSLEQQQVLSPVRG
jgi:hypothetical protein